MQMTSQGNKTISATRGGVDAGIINAPDKNVKLSHLDVCVSVGCSDNLIAGEMAKYWIQQRNMASLQ